MHTLVVKLILNLTVVPGCSVLLAEFIRDTYHVLSHINPVLWHWHRLHHQLFGWNYQTASPEAYRHAQWCYDVPEALVMLGGTLLIWVGSLLWSPDYQWGVGIGVLYCLWKVQETVALASGFVALESDTQHQPQDSGMPPARWLVNHSYHWRHHFDDSNAYFCGSLSLVDQLMGTSLVLRGKTIAVTGASGSMGRALLQRLHQEGAKVIALSSQSQPVAISVEGQVQIVRTVTWKVGSESDLADLLEEIDILVLNHGIYPRGARTATDIFQSYEVNTFSTWRLLELFLTTVQTTADRATKEVWVNTSEAEVIGSASPLYELSKGTLGRLITLRRLDSPCVIRKIILGDFKSQLNPTGGPLSADWIAGRIVTLAKRDVRNIIVTLDPRIYLLFPIKELMEFIKFRFFSHPAPFQELLERT